MFLTSWGKMHEARHHLIIPFGSTSKPASRTLLRLTQFCFSDAFDCGNWLLYVVCTISHSMCITFNKVVRHFSGAISSCG